jgi:hypothetical protein
MVNVINFANAFQQEEIVQKEQNDGKMKSNKRIEVRVAPMLLYGRDQ